MRRQRLLILGGDLAVASVSLGLAIWLTTLTVKETLGLARLPSQPTWLYLLVPAWLFINHSIYDLRQLNSRLSHLRSLLIAGGIAFGIYLFVFFIAPPVTLPRLVILYFLVGAVFLTVAWRFAYIALTRTWPRRVLVVGGGRAGLMMAKELAAFRRRTFIILGLIDDTPDLAGMTIDDIPVLGGHHRLGEFAQSLNITDLVLATTGEIEGALFQAIADCRSIGLEVISIAELYEQVTGRVPIYQRDETWLLSSFDSPPPAPFVSRILTRLFDIGTSVIGLLGLSIVLTPVALAIWLESGGPIFYHQVRAGFGGRPFTLFKFRTMSPDAEGDGLPRWANPEDARATRVGRWLRRTRIDEMPQFWNIFKGEMSLIGPRPERPELITHLETRIPFYRARLQVKPGLTGWAQINYQYAATVDQTAIKLQYDLYYIKHRSLWLNMLILWETLSTVIRQEGS